MCETQNEVFFNFDKNRAKTGMELLSGCRLIKKSISRFSTPFICLQGKEDIHCSFETSEKFYKESISKDKTFIQLNDFKNGFFNFLF
jgi:esterase/lipase